ncbi:aconitate hydratase AcnA [Entomobacter blattae]|uniref:Aconitate hydratase n=1 Tax=Entomobacter blattae TaxID=2762277 RepID=A0A7H1NPK3_9PROT|nr:aconitate hydratase AcnA [Entomobacter blattae]QNT77713.1 Aconitate hydratase A [Entomobacter blattae]
MQSVGRDKLETCQVLEVDGKPYHYFSLQEAQRHLGDINRLPISLKVLLENILRYEDGKIYTVEHAQALADWQKQAHSDQEVPFRPARILMQDFTGVPAVVDLAAMRDGIKHLKGDPQKVNPLVPVDLVVDHSVIVDYSASSDSLQKNVALEFERNAERYAFLRWGQEAFQNFRVVPPGMGICHQVNLEYLTQAVWVAESAQKTYAYPDTLFGTDSHTTMVNGVGVLGWGVGGIEAEAAMLGQPIAMLIPDVIGVKLTGQLQEGVTATDLVLTVTEILRKKGVVGKFVEFFGSALDHLPVPDRATIANMAPEYGATCGFFPIDALTLDYFYQTGRYTHRIALTKAYLQAQGMFRNTETPDPVFTDVVELDLGSIEPSLAGPRRPQDRVGLSQAAISFKKVLEKDYHILGAEQGKEVPVEGANYALKHGAIVIAAITSCTNTSNPAVLLAAGLVAKKARALGLKPKPWVKTSFAPGSQVVSDYLQVAGVQNDLDALGFEVVGYGCTTCIGNSGPLPQPVINAIESHNLVGVSVLSGNRNFEGRISPNVRANYLASPPLVVAYALLGTMTDDITRVPLGYNSQGKAIYLKDLWPRRQEIEELMAKAITREQFVNRYSRIFEGTREWQSLKVAQGSETYPWDDHSTYVRNPPYFTGITFEPSPQNSIRQARILALLGDNITTDHISPAGSIKKSSPAGIYLQNHHVQEKDFNSYGSRRGNHEVMMRGTFANIRIRNRMVADREGGITCHYPDGRVAPIYDVAMEYKKEAIPLVVIGGREYGMGSSRDWAAKGVALLGVKAVIAVSFERIHRSNLVGMGVLPLTFKDGMTAETLGLTGKELFDIDIPEQLKPRQELSVTITYDDGSKKTVSVLSRVDTVDEVGYYRQGGILSAILREMAREKA